MNVPADFDIDSSDVPLPERIENEQQLEDVMTTPSKRLIEYAADLKGDLLILGVAGKMGPTLALLARRALDAAGVTARVIGVARFTNPDVRRYLEAGGVETVTADLLNPDAVGGLPEAPNVIYMVGYKFGATGNEAMTWAVNTYLPALIAPRYARSRIVALSTGNVYPLVPVAGGGPDEDHPLGPVGEYAQSCLGRERVFQYFSRKNGTPVLLFRLNYAIDLRYGVLLDVARKVYASEPVDLTMGYVNLIWQGEANAAVFRSLAWCESPPKILNVTGPEVVSIRSLTEAFGKRFDRQPVLQGREADNALLSDPARYVRLGRCRAVPLERMIDWVAHWVRIGGATWDKPTNFEVRDGKF